MPQIESKEKCNGSKSNQQPSWRPVFRHHPRVGPIREERANANVNAIGDKTETSEKAEQIHSRSPSDSGYNKNSTGSPEPMRGPPQTTASGCGFSARSVWDMISG